MSKDKHWLGTKAGKPFASRKTAIDHMRKTGIAGVIKEHPNYGYGIQVKSYTEEDKSRLLTYDAEEYRLKALEAKEEAAENAVAKSPMERYEALSEDDDAADMARHEARMARKRIREKEAVNNVAPEEPKPEPKAKPKKAKGKPKKVDEVAVEAPVEAPVKETPKSDTNAKATKKDPERTRLDASLKKSNLVIEENPLTSVQNRIRGQQLFNKTLESRLSKGYISDWTKAIAKNKKFNKAREKELKLAWYAAQKQDYTFEKKKAKEENRKVSEEIQAHAMNAQFDDKREKEFSKAWYAAHREDKSRTLKEEVIAKRDETELSKLWSAAIKEDKQRTDKAENDEFKESKMLHQAYDMNDKVDTKIIEKMIKEDTKVQSQEDNIRNAYWKQGQAEAGKVSDAEEKAKYQGWLINNRERGDDKVFSNLSSLPTGTDTSEVKKKIEESGFYDRKEAYVPTEQELTVAKRMDSAFEKKRSKEFDKAWYAAHRENNKRDSKAESEELKNLEKALKDNTKATVEETSTKKKESKAQSIGNVVTDTTSNVFDKLGSVAGAAFKAAAATAGTAIVIGNAVANNAEREQIGGAATGYTRSGYAGLLKQMGLGNRVGDQVLGAASNVTHQVMQSPDALSGILERMATANALGGGKGLDLQGIAKDLLKGDTDSYINRMKDYTEANEGNERVIAAVTGVVGLQQLSRSNKVEVDSDNVDQRAAVTDEILANRIKMESALADALGGNLQPAIEGGAEAMRGFVAAAKEVTGSLLEEAPNLTETGYTGFSSVVDEVAGEKVMNTSEEVKQRLTDGNIKSRFNPEGKPLWTDKLKNAWNKFTGKSTEPTKGEAVKVLNGDVTESLDNNSYIDEDVDFDYAPHKADEDPIPLTAYATNEAEFMSKYEGKSPEERAEGYAKWQQTPQFKEQMKSLYGSDANLSSSNQELNVKVEVEGTVQPDGTIKLSQQGTSRVTSKTAMNGGSYAT